jgi:hypothetical protein
VKDVHATVKRHHWSHTSAGLPSSSPFGRRTGRRP